MEWPSPKYMHEVRNFMGLVSYYKRYVENFSRIIGLISSLQKKGAKFKWANLFEEKF